MTLKKRLWSSTKKRNQTMSDISSRIVNVIETRNGSTITYFTLEGLLIGGFEGGNRVAQPEVKIADPIKSAVVMPPTPQQIRKQRDREVEKLQTAEGRLEHLKKEVA